MSASFLFLSLSIFGFRKSEEGSTITVECLGAGNTRSLLTLEEATDTILFCSSIIHDLAYQAATIAMEKEHSDPLPFEGSEPTVEVAFVVSFLEERCGPMIRVEGGRFEVDLKVEWGVGAVTVRREGVDLGLGEAVTWGGMRLLFLFRRRKMSGREEGSRGNKH
ncbi:hypothetical protein RIF29_29210 [Crotalaria pallida]|uniref:Uncharacterized protein n=1 Tax=Crotalaria pallida TaxID=3830 RepID=A0AAN9HX97_CROPI